MSTQHTDKHTSIICPNCGFKADHNYCAQCGQETHLHKETFWGLIMHFIGHYFHYDSKFWQTLKALWFSPGKLTKAYMLNQRMRYIPPISLYIFTSAVFFLLMFSMPKSNVRNGVHNVRNGMDKIEDRMDEGDSIAAAEARRTYRYVDSLGRQSDTNKGRFTKYLDSKFKKVQEEHGKEASKYVMEKFIHNFPKIFFFMIPAVALMLRIFFLRRKGLHFVHHAIFSLHLHSFFFSVLVLTYLNPFASITTTLNLILFLICVIYSIVSLKRVYEIGYTRAIFSSIFLGFGYLIFFTIAIVAIFMAVFVAA